MHLFPGKAAWNKCLILFLSEAGPWSVQGMCLESVCSNFLEPTRTCPYSWGDVLPPSHSCSKTVPAAAGSIFSCTIDFNTCPTIPDRAWSWTGGASGPPQGSSPAQLHLLVGIHPAAKGCALPQIWVWSHHPPGGRKSPDKDSSLFSRGSGETQEPNTKAQWSNVRASHPGSYQRISHPHPPFSGGRLPMNSISFIFLPGGNRKKKRYSENCYGQMSSSVWSFCLCLLLLKCKVHSPSSWLWSHLFSNSKPTSPGLPSPWLVPGNLTALCFQDRTRSVLQCLIF